MALLDERTLAPTEPRAYQGVHGHQKGPFIVISATIFWTYDSF